MAEIIDPNLQYPREQLAFSPGAFNALAKTAMQLENARAQATSKLIEFAEADLPARDAAILDACLYVEYEGHPQRPTGNVAVRRAPEEVEQTFAAFEALLLDKDEVVVFLRPRVDGYETDKDKVVLSGELTYKVSEHPHRPAKDTTAEASDNPELYFFTGNMLGGRGCHYAAEDVSKAAEEDDLRHGRVMLAGVEPTHAYMKILAQCDSAKAQDGKIGDRISFWDFAELHGMLLQRGIDVTEHDSELTAYLESNVEAGQKFAEQMIRNGYVQSLRDADHLRAEVPDHTIAQRDLLARTIPAVKALGLSEAVLTILDHIDEPIVKESKLLPGQLVSLSDPHQCFPDGLSAEESVRRDELRAKIVAEFGEN